MLLKDYLIRKYGERNSQAEFAHEFGRPRQSVNRWCSLGATIDENGRIRSAGNQQRLLFIIPKSKL